MINNLRKLAISVIFMALCTGPAYAKKPDLPGSIHNNNAENRHDLESASNDEKPSYQGFFDSERRTVISNYYSKKHGSGNCPPGLAKKNNGCQPPGQAKKWRRGYPLPDDVRYYDLPRALLRELGRMPEGHKVVRVGTDFLLLNVGTGMVVDALEDLRDIF